MSTEVPSLAKALSEIEDFRQAQGRRYELLPVLLLACVAMMCGCSSQAAIADWSKNYGFHWLAKLGFNTNRGPSQSTLHRIFKGIDPLCLEKALAYWIKKVIQHFRCSPVEPLLAVAIDGKTLCGSSKQRAKQAHLLAGLSHSLGLVMAQVAVSEKCNEITQAHDLLDMLVLKGAVITGDAMFTQQKIASKIVSRGGDYLFSVKDNQPSLLEDCQMAFIDRWWMGDTISEAKTVDQHADRLEERHLKASTALQGYSKWPGLSQVLKLERRITNKRTKVSRQEVAYAITSLDKQRAGAEDLLKMWREHWHIENKLHYVRDVTFREDLSQVRTGHIPQIMAALRNAAISLMRMLGAKNIAAACRRYAAQPALALAAVGLDLRE
jgi:predicted transposase YbfD/YdcC